MTTQPEALRLAEELDDGYPLTGDAISAAAELRTQHARITELEAQLSAIGAGGVSPLRNAAQETEATHLRELAAPSTDQVEEILRERDDADDFIDALLDEVLGPERPEWSSAYGRADALNDVRERMTALPESFLEIPDVQDESGINAYYSREVVLECIDAALASHGQAPATAQADSVTAPVLDYPPLPEPDIVVGIDGQAQIFTGQGVVGDLYFTADQMRAYIDSDRAARAPADSVLAPAGGVDDAVDAIALARYKVVPSHESMFHRFAVVAGDGKQQLYLGREVECENMARKFAGAFLDGAFYQANITPSTQAAGSVPAVEREQERIAFKDAHRHLELYEVPDAWGRPMFKHSHVEASWLGWIARASHGQAPAGATKPTEQQILEAAEKAGLWPNTVHSWIPAFHRYHKELAKAQSAPARADSVLEDADRYRWLAAHCRSTSEHWGGRWSIVVEGPAPKSHDSEDDFDAAIDAGRKQGANHDR